MLVMRRHRVLPLVAGLLLLVAPAARAQTPPSINWRTDYAQARREAQDKNLPLLLDFCMQGCIPCKKLEETTFRDAKVLALISEKFVALKVEQEKDPNLVSALRIHGFPTLVLAGAD